MSHRPGIASAVGDIISLVSRQNNGEAVSEVRSWLKENYENYPEGVDTIKKSKHEGVVVVELEEEIELGVLSDIFEERGYFTEIQRSEEETTLNVYERITYADGGSAEHLQEVFQLSKTIPIGKSPLADGVNFRLEVLREYLSRKYG